MKKIKILPSILMLIACVAVLSVGVFAIAPTQNTISGSITINASNTPVSIELFIDNVSQGDPVDVRSGKTFDIGALEFNTSGVNSVSEVKNRKVTLKVTNLSTTQSLGVYFYKNDTELVDGMADVQNIMLEEPVYANNSEDRIATAYFTPYYYLGKNDGNTTTNGTDDFEFDTVEMNINFECFQLFNESKSYDFNYQLNIEPYVGNVDNSDLVQDVPTESWEYGDIGPSTVDVNLIKLSETVTTIPAFAFYGNTDDGDHMIVIPSSVTKVNSVELIEFYPPEYSVFDNVKNVLAMSINANVEPFYFYEHDWQTGKVIAVNCNIETICWIENVERIELSHNVTILPQVGSCENLQSMEIPNSVITIPERVFYYCKSLKSIEIPSSVTSIDTGAFCNGGNYFVECGAETITIKAGTPATFGVDMSGWKLNGETLPSGSKMSRVADKDNVYTLN